MAVNIGNHTIQTDPQEVAAEKQRLNGMTQAERDQAVKDAKEIIGIANRARGAAGIESCTKQGATIEAAGITDVAHNDRDLLLP